MTTTVGGGIATVREVFTPGGHDLDTIPDFDAEAERYKQRAAEYGVPSG